MNARHAVIAAALIALAQGAHAQDAPVLTGQVLLYGEARQRATTGPLAQGHRLAPDVIHAGAAATGQIDASARLKWLGIEAAATALGSQDGGRSGKARLRLDELFYAADTAHAQRVTAGKRVVSWDVGYAFRPNDLIQDEDRRTLVPRTLEGRPLVMLEGYGDDSSWSLLAAHTGGRAPDAHPNASAQAMLAGRYYRHAGAADLYGFAGFGTRTRATAGAAFSWVPTDALELHGSYRLSQRARYQSTPASGAPVPSAASPYIDSWHGHAHQIMIGGTWTGESKLSLIAEGWYDASAPSNRFWSQWASRNAALDAAASCGAPLPAVAGNYGWQAQQLSRGPLRRANLYARLSWTHDAWEPTLDVLYMPGGGGAVITAGVTWTGERVKVAGGIRTFRGPPASLAVQLPVRTLAYVGLTVAF